MECNDRIESPNFDLSHGLINWLKYKFNLMELEQEFFFLFFKLYLTALKRNQYMCETWFCI